MSFMRRVGLVFGILALLVVTGGCKSSPPSYEKSSFTAFKEYRATRPVPSACDLGECIACKPADRDAHEAIVTGDVKVDGVSAGVSNLYTASVHKLEDYVTKSENSREWIGFTNDVDACQESKETDEEKANCFGEVFEKLTPEDQAAVVAFMEANQGTADENLRALVGLAEISASVAALVGEYKAKDFGLKDAARAGAITRCTTSMTTQVSYMESTQRFYKQQKARMDFLKEHKGR